MHRVKNIALGILVELAFITGVLVSGFLLGWLMSAIFNR